MGLQFAWMYETYLDAVYRPAMDAKVGSGRQGLAESIANGLRSRGATRVLDCAAGTGFPGLDLADMASDGSQIHCTDASVEMLTVFLALARQRGIDTRPLAPPDLAVSEPVAGVGEHHLDWSDLGRLPADYDYVMCRGNSLAYANSWSLDRKEVASIGLIKADLQQMKERLKPGGHLHVDAPWRLDLPQTDYAPVVSGAVTINEKVAIEEDRRRWTLDFEVPRIPTLSFQRFSTLLTIDNVKEILDDLGFQETQPFQLDAERPGFGVIIARKPS